MLNIETVEEIEPGRVWAVSELPGASVVRAASADDPKAGYWIGNYHVTRYHGTRANGFQPQQWLLHKWKENEDGTRRYVGFVEDWINRSGELMHGMRSSRAVVQEITGEAAPWTFPAMARALVRWLCISQSRSSALKSILPEWHYQYCLPFHSDNAAMYDLDAAYWQMAEAARSPVFDVIDGRIVWRSLTTQQEERWNTLVDKLRPYKLLRLAVIGACAAGWQRRRDNWHGSDNYRAGEPAKQGEFPSPLQPLALLSVRCTYEATQVQSDIANSLYSNADCVTTETAPGMEYWEELGLRYKLKAQGAAFVHAVGAWKIGTIQTDNFNLFYDANRYDPHTTPFRLNETNFHRQILVKRREI